MKRVKIMMLSFALLAVVAGALAFKAKFNGVNACYTTTTDPAIPTVCEDAVLKYTVAAPTTVIYTTPKQVFQGNIQCTKDPDGNDLICTTPLDVRADN